MIKITSCILLKYINENNIELYCTQQKLCVPIIDRIYRKMLAGIKFAQIKTVDGLIGDGHHRYLASLLARYSIEEIPYATTSAMLVIDWKSVLFDKEDWDTPAKIKMLNEMDADYNNIPIEKLNDLLK